MFSNLFEVEQTNHRIDLLTHKGRSEITNATRNWWESQGWQVVMWDNTGNLPAVGRNKILRDWKNSDRPLLIMADDDITLYTHRYLTAEWLKQPIARGVYTLNSNHKMGILHFNSTGWNNGEYYWKQSMEISQFYVITNKSVPYQDETLPALEDVYWAKQCNDLGIETKILLNVFLREQSQDRGSLIAKTRQERKVLYQQAKKIMESKCH